MSPERSPPQEEPDDFVVYEARTHGVIVRAAPKFLEDQSDPDEGRYFWAYTIEIENDGDSTVQLIARRWRILDKTGRAQEVSGPGVVGEQPILRPGEIFTYTSGAPLGSPSGVMMGVYVMVDEHGRQFDAEIPAFSLDSPHDRRSLN
jgi:ApaG protein